MTSIKHLSKSKSPVEAGRIPALAIAIDGILAECTGSGRHTPCYWDNQFSPCDGVDLENMAFDIAGGNYSLTLLACRTPMWAGTPAESDPTFLTRQWLSRHRLEEVNLFAELEDISITGILQFAHVDFFLTDDIYDYENAPEGTAAFLLTRDHNINYSTRDRVASVDEFIRIATKR